MRKQMWSVLGMLLLALPAEAVAQVDLSRATYIGVEQWRDTVNALPGVDRQLVSQDIGKLNLSGGGTLITGGSILNGRMSGPESTVTTTLNGPSCSGQIVGDVQRRDVVVGDIVIIPAGVPHGWANIPRHVDYLSVRPDPDRVLPSDYVHPSITLYR